MQTVSMSHQVSLAHSIAPSVKNLWNLAVLIVPSHNPVRKMSSPATNSLACWLQLGWNLKIYPWHKYILLTMWNNLHISCIGSRMFIIIWWRVACVWWLIKSSVTGFHVEHMSICAKNCAWCTRRLASFAFACVLVRRWWSLTSCILNPSGNTVALDEYRYLIQLLVTVWWTLSILMCSAFTGVFSSSPFFCHHLLLNIRVQHGPQQDSKFPSLMLLDCICWLRIGATLHIESLWLFADLSSTCLVWWIFNTSQWFPWLLWGLVLFPREPAHDMHHQLFVGIVYAWTSSEVGEPLVYP